MNNAEQPAYPVEITHGETGEILGAQLSNNTGMALGLSKREYFAGLAMASLARCFYDGKLHEKRVAECAVKYADALLAELEKPQS